MGYHQMQPPSVNCYYKVKNNLNAPWLALSGFFTLALVLSLLIYIGEATRDAFDPRRQK